MSFSVKLSRSLLQEISWPDASSLTIS